MRVRLDQGNLTSVMPLALLGGANAAAIQAPDGGWEVIQFQTATLVAPSTYELSTVLRAQAGTEGAMSTTLPAGAAFVLLDEALTPVPLARTDIGLPLQWRFGPGSRDIGDAAYTTVAHAYAGAGLRPLSPVHIRGRRKGGDLVISWVRRTRVGGDSWNQTEVPLAEESERYEIDILDGVTVKRTLSASTPTATYLQSDQIADFGAPPTRVTVRVAQIGALGRGTPRIATL